MVDDVPATMPALYVAAALLGLEKFLKDAMVLAYGKLFFFSFGTQHINSAQLDLYVWRFLYV
jgi:hypothetical protein